MATPKTTAELAHLWVHKRIEKATNAQKTTATDRNFLSYSSVIAQWLDPERGVIGILPLGLTTKTTNQHIYHVVSATPPEVTVFRYAINTGRHYRHADLLDGNKSFTATDRLRLVGLWVDELFTQFKRIPSSSAISDERINFTPLNQIEKLNSLYRNDASLLKWSKNTKVTAASKQKDHQLKRKMALALRTTREVGAVVDAMYGAGTWEAYVKRTASERKRAVTRAYTKKVCQYMGTVDHRGTPIFSYKQVTQMTPYERMQIRLHNLWLRSPEREQQLLHRERSENQLLKYIGARADKKRGRTLITQVTNRFTGEIIYQHQSNAHYWSVSELKWTSELSKSYRTAPDKQHWIKRFYQMAGLRMKLQVGERLLSNGINEHLTLTPYEQQAFSIASARRQKRDRQVEERKRRLRAEVAERNRMIEQLKAEGVSGYRKLWYQRLTNIHQIPDNILQDSAFYYGGNVLLRVRNNAQIESSKGICIAFKEAKRLWKLVEEWIERPDTFTQTTVISANCGSFTISEFADGLMRAGCHTISVTEMRQAYEAILEQEKLNKQQ